MSEQPGAVPTERCIRSVTLSGTGYIVGRVSDDLLKPGRTVGQHIGRKKDPQVPNCPRLIESSFFF